MLSTKDIQELLNFHLDSPELVSLYLELDGSPPLAQFQALLKAHPPCKQSLEGSADSERITRFLTTELLPQNHRGLALFSAQRSSLWLVCPLPEPVPSLIRIGPQPYLVPLLNLLEQYRRYGVALVTAQKVKFMEVYLGQIEECTEDLESPAPDQRISDGLQRHLKIAADRLLALSRKKGFNRVILAAPQELEAILFNHIHSTMQNNLILDTQINPDTPAPDILQRALAIELQSRHVRESVLIHRVLDAARTGGLGVMGLADTLSALEHGLVRLLLIDGGLAKMGRKCPGCGILSLNGKRCHACYQITTPLFNLIDEMVQQALDLNCEVIRIHNDPRLNNVGGIGAELKFKPAPGEPLPKARAQQCLKKTSLT